MLKRLVIGGLILVVLIGGGVYFWAQSIFSSDLVRRQVAAQLSRSLGQPVEIGGIGASIFPRVTMALSDVRIGSPAAITVDRLDVGTAFGALLSRRIENADAHLTGARITLPLPTFAFDSATDADTSDDSPAVTLVSINEVVLRDVEIVSGGRVLRGDIDVVPRADGMTIRAMTLHLGDTPIDVTGEISSFDGPVGELSLKTDDLDLFQLLAFVTDFSAGVDTPESTSTSTPAGGVAAASPRRGMDITVSIETARAIMGTLALEALGGRARVSNDRVTLDPVTFGVFDGRYEGSLVLGLSDTPDFRVRASIADLNMASFSAFAGHPDIITGRLAGTFDVAGRGTSPDEIVSSAQGTTRVDVRQGSIKGLGLVRTTVLALSMRAESASQADVNLEAEPFSHMGGSFTIGGGRARTDDLRFESNDVLLSARGAFALDGSAIDLAGPLQLSDALSQQAGRDLVRYTQDGGRVTVPARITGSADRMQVTIDAAALMKRAITNKAAEEAGKAIQRGLGGLFNRGSER